MWVVDEMLRKVFGWVLGGLRKIKWGLVVVAGTPVAGNGREAVREMSLRETESEMRKRGSVKESGR